MLGNWNVIAKETANNNIPGQKAVSSSLPNMRAELSSEQMLSSSVPGQDATAAQRIRHVTRIVHRNRGGSKKMNLATALLIIPRHRPRTYQSTWVGPSLWYSEGKSGFIY